jgi:hypothetical protein
MVPAEKPTLLAADPDFQAKHKAGPRFQQISRPRLTASGCTTEADSNIWRFDTFTACGFVGGMNRSQWPVSVEGLYCRSTGQDAS